MSDFEKWYDDYAEVYPTTPPSLVQVWNASRAALIGEVKPVAWIPLDALRQLLPPRIRLLSVPLITYEADEHAALFTAEALAAAVANEREACIKVCENRFLEWADEEGNDEYAAGAHDCAAAIRGMKP